MKKILIIILIGLASACSSHKRELEQALEYAGNNRAELEKVLTHYSQHEADHLKLKAAEFLIANMPGHWSLHPDSIKAYYIQADSILGLDTLWNAKVDLLNHLTESFPDLEKSIVQDIHIITADYLIKNIDSSFVAWQKGQWARHVPFDDFCEYLLPYKVTEGQPLDYWRDSLEGKFCEGLEYFRFDQYKKNSPSSAAAAIRNNMRRQMAPRITLSKRFYSLLSENNITRLPAGTCGDYAQVVLAVMRANRIPVVSDMVIQWPYKGGGGGHSWNVILDNLRTNMFFEELNGVAPGNMIRPTSKLGKVYRNTYAINRDLQEMNLKEKLPPGFRNSFLKDVTAQYTPVVHTTVDILPHMKSRNRYACLAVFDNQDWMPVAISKIKGKQIRFENVEPDIVYLPVCYVGEKLHPLNYPFLLDYEGNARYFAPDTTHLRRVVINRKFPLFTRVIEVSMRTVHAKIQVSETADFAKPVTVHQIDQFRPSGTIGIPDSVSAYRFWRFLAPDNEYCNIADLMFYRIHDTIPLAGKVIGQGGVHPNNNQWTFDKAFDGDPLTFYHSATKNGSWVGLDFGEPMKIKKIIYLPRSDDDNIRIGDEYELFYRTANGWCSLGKQLAKDITVTFDNVPDNALLWLRDHTRGQEERIFTYENNEQIWW